LAAAAYNKQPLDPENVSLPRDWREIEEGPAGVTDGLHYKVFTKGNELVISFRGTDSGLDRLFDLDDWPAALGKMSSQI
jgi:putative lipase involved disintegration of autophagic bodies